MSGPETTWTNARTARAKALWLDGYSATQIADLLGGGLTRLAVSGKIHRLKLSGTVRRTNAPPPIKRAHHNKLRAHNITKKLDDWKTAPGLKAEPAKVVAGAPESKRLTLLELNDRMCKYSADDGPPWTFCGADAEPGSSWCSFHKRIVIQKVSVAEANRRADRAARGG